jgi:hypothetical protein
MYILLNDEPYRQLQAFLARDNNGLSRVRVVFGLKPGQRGTKRPSRATQDPFMADIETYLEAATRASTMRT